VQQNDFIEVYDNVLPAQACAEILRRFERSGQHSPGMVGGGHFPDLKHSRDISLAGRADWKDLEQQLNVAVFGGLQQYLRKYAYAMIAPLMLQRGGADGKPTRLAREDFDAMPNKQLAQLCMQVLRPGHINVQRYTANEGGYPYWHCELYPKDASCETLHRHLLWTIYLNDAFEEGETEFVYQQRRIVPKTGSLLIAPTAFTHTHRGNMPRGGDKYIATSWILFQRSEVLFPTK
jgi:hypothetical protein